MMGLPGGGELLLLIEAIAPLDEKNAYDGKVLVISLSIYTSSFDATFVFLSDK